MFGGYEWVVTEKYDSGSEEHVSLKEGIEVGNGLPTLATPAMIKANLEEAGFEVRRYTVTIKRTERKSSIRSTREGGIRRFLEVIACLCTIVAGPKMLRPVCAKLRAKI